MSIGLENSLNELALKFTLKTLIFQTLSMKQLILKLPLVLLFFLLDILDR